jgi:hypothetical protein
VVQEGWRRRDKLLIWAWKDWGHTIFLIIGLQSTACQWIVDHTNTIRTLDVRPALHTWGTVNFSHETQRSTTHIHHSASISN